MIGVFSKKSARTSALADISNFFVFVGVTGVGKTTTIDLLSKKLKNICILPERRVMTDKFLFPIIQNELGLPRSKVDDRSERFRLTREFRRRHNGGMSDVLKNVYVDNQFLENIVIFDGIRGVQEVRHFLTNFPKAKLIILHAPDYVRVCRLATRNDKFDKLKPTQNHSQILKNLRMVGKTKILAEVRSGNIDIDKLKKAISIIQEERKNYNPDAAKRLLEQSAMSRSLVIDTVKHNPSQVIAIVYKFITKHTK